MKNSIKFSVALFCGLMLGAQMSWAACTMQQIALNLCNPATGSVSSITQSDLDSIQNLPPAKAATPSGLSQDADGNYIDSTVPTVSNSLSSLSSSGASGGGCAIDQLTNTQTADMEKDFQDIFGQKSVPKYGKTQPDQQTITDTDSCFSHLRQNTQAIVSAVKAADQGNAKGLCMLQGKLTNKSFGMTDGEMFASSKADQALTAYNSVWGKFTDTFKPTNSGVPPMTCTQSQASGGNADDTVASDTFGFCAQYCSGSTVKTYATECGQIGNRLEQLLATKVGTAECYKTAYSGVGTALKAGAIAAGVAAVGVVAAAIIKHHKDETRDNAQNAYNNAIIQVNGQNVDCKQSTTYTASQCQAPLMNYCSLSANTTSAGCGAFNTYYCAQSGSSVSYCLSSTARSYCGNTVSTVSGLTSASSTTVTLANSPSCQWLSGMPPNCPGAPTYTAQTGTTLTSNQLSCLTAMSASQLAATCPNYTSDPLCQAYNSGQVVYQSSGATGTVTAAVGTTTSTLPAAAGSTTSSSTSITSTGTNISTTNLGGFTGVGKVVTRNMFAESSSTLSSLCHSGSSQLIGCH